MEEPYKNLEQQTKKWIQEAGLENPSATFKMKILEKIKFKSLQLQTTPLISKTGWFVLSSIFVASIVLLYLYPSKLFSMKGDKVSAIFGEMMNFKTISVSSTTQYAFLFLALFLIQLPFLKQFLDKQRV